MSDIKTYRIDASSTGCSGLFWRTEPVYSSTSRDYSWPKNGTIVKGVEAQPGWIKIDGTDYWLPIEHGGHTFVHAVSASTK